MHKLENTFKNTILTYGLIKEKDKICVALSGGVDSVVLFYLLVDLRKHIDFDLSCAHINHMLRAEDADRDELFVKKLAEKYEVDCFVRKVDVSSLSKKIKKSSEETGREVRYDFFKEIMEKHNIDKIALAHHKNDQAETVIMRIIRGSGTDGLIAMEYQRDNFIRPMLDISKDEILNYSKNMDIAYVDDYTNQIADVFRNKVRLELLPYIENNFNPQIVDALSKLSALASEDKKIIDEFVDEQFKKIVKNENNKYIIEKNLFNSLNNGLKYRIIRRIIETISGDILGISMKNILDICELAKNSHGKIYIINDIKFENIRDELVCYKNRDEELIEKYELFFVDKSLKIPYTNLVLHKNFVDFDYTEKNPPNSNRIYIDADKISDLYIRNRRDGDKFIPFAYFGHKKLKDLFIDYKLSKTEKEKVGILMSDNKIISVIGYRRSNIALISKNSKKIIMIEIKKGE